MNVQSVTVGTESLKILGASRTNIRRLKDKIATKIVSIGGGLVLFSVLAILVVILLEILPIFGSPSLGSARVTQLEIGGVIKFAGVDEYREVAIILSENGKLNAISLTNGSPIPLDFPNNGDLARSVKFAQLLSQGRLLMVFDDGATQLLKFSFEANFAGSERKIIPRVELETRSYVPKLDPALNLLSAVYPEKGLTIATFGNTISGQISLYQAKETRSLMGDSKFSALSGEINLSSNTKISALLLDERGENLIVGTTNGYLLAYRINTLSAPERLSSVRVTESNDVAVSSLGFAIGGRTILVGDSSGAVSSWRLIKGDGGVGLNRVHRFVSHSEGVLGFAASERSRLFVSYDRSGQIKLHFATSGDTRLQFKTPAEALSLVGITTKSDGIFAVLDSGKLIDFSLSDPHPESSFKALFSPVWYEGYQEPAHVWQSTGGTDDFESKLGLVPLIFGTLKGTLYALVFAVPIAIFAALYTSQFMSKRIKTVVKPVVEFMAAMPSVVLGFIAGLWLAPFLENKIIGVFLIPVVLLLLVLLTFSLIGVIDKRFDLRIGRGTEFAILVPIALLSVYLAFAFGSSIEVALLGGDFRLWLGEHTGMIFDQRNSIVAGIAIAFCVIPIIFTISEDVLSSVPRHLVAGSLALGASRWQTALLVVLPVAIPGIFSAVMVGLGRAIGETMIVLMATGNTPIMDLSPFNGFRALSANIAVELPEAAQGGTLYRILFLTAFILFVFTAVLNTISEVVRMKLRKKFSQL